MSRTFPSTQSTLNSGLNSFCTAVASGDIEVVKRMIERDGVDVNKRATDGSVPLCTAAFWGYADIVNLLLRNNADINGCNKATGWTAAHCAAFQGHGRALMFLLQHNPDLTIKDTLGRTAVDFASAQEQIWPFFSVLGCTRTPKQKLINLEVIKKAPDDLSDPMMGNKPATQHRPLSQFSRPGSSYVLNTVTREGAKVGTKPSAATLYGDVLSEES